MKKLIIKILLVVFFGLLAVGSLWSYYGKNMIYELHMTMTNDTSQNIDNIELYLHSSEDIVLKELPF